MKRYTFYYLLFVSAFFNLLTHENAPFADLSQLSVQYGVIAKGFSVITKAENIPFIRSQCPMGLTSGLDAVFKLPH